MTTAEKLLQISEGVDKVEALNTELAQTLYGGDTGYRGHYDEFWDEFQKYGNRTRYMSGFAGDGWTNKTFKPKYNIAGNQSMSSLFYACGIKGDLVEILSNAGVTLDTSKTTSLNSAFNSTYITRVGVISCEGITSASGCLQIFIQSTKLVTIDKLILKSDGSQKLTSSFDGCSALENLTIEGVIGQNGFDVQYSPKLSKASITSIINALSTTTNGLTVTLSKTAVESAFGSTTSTEWTNLIGTRSNWTISLV